MEKMKLPLRQFLTLVGPAQLLEIKEDEAKDPEEIIYSGKAAKIRDHAELHNRDVKFILPAAAVDDAGKYILKIVIY